MSMWDNFSFPASSEGSGIKDEEGNELEDITSGMPYVDEELEGPTSKETKGSNTKVVEEEEEEEEEIIEEEEEIKEPSLKEEEEVTEDDYSYKGFIDALAEGGVIRFDEEKEYEDSEEGVKEIFKDNARIVLEEEIESYGPDFKRLLEVARAGGNPRDAFEELQDNRYLSIDLDDEEERTDLLKEYYETIGMDEEIMQEKLEMLESAGLEVQKKEAVIAKKYMARLDEARKEEYVESIKQAKKQEEDNKQQGLLSLKETIENTDELNGFVLTKDLRSKLYEHLTKPVTKDGKTQLMINRQDPQKQLFAVFLDMINYDITKLEKQVKSKATGDIRKAVMGFQAKAAQGKTVNTPTPTKRIPKGPWDSRRVIED